ncbi:MAG TPA: pitrilysin family protein [Candidatus Sulfotelmatobacter sp.]|nr:pitrilysin family protein [Candidatus Sulfotelmatobacter sp.]
MTSGLTLVSETMPHRRSVAIGVWLRTGARDEPVERLGITHFLEHMMFKGTARRDARAIARSLESVGGHLDAFTGREQVCYYARCLVEHLPTAVDVLADIVCHSRFAEHELEREKSVVREEIFSCEDNPEDKVNDLHAEQIWGDHPLGRPILGRVETVDALTRPALSDYFQRRYRADHLVITATGAIQHDQLLELITKHFDPPEGEPLPLSPPPLGFSASVRHEVRDDLQQLYLTLGTRGLAYTDAERYPLVALNALLGGGMSSRLFQSVREEAGLAYSVYSTVDFHRDGGLFGIQLGVAPDRGREALARVRHELTALVSDGPTEEEVDAAIAQLCGSVLMGQESVSNRMYHLAHEEIYRGHYTPPEEQVARIRAVTPAQVRAVAARFLPPGGFALTALGPAAGAPLSEQDWRIDAA